MRTLLAGLFLLGVTPVTAQLIDVFNEEVMTGPLGGIPEGYSTYRIYARVLNSNDAVAAVVGFSGTGDANFHSVQIGSTAGDSLVWNTTFGGMTAQNVVPGIFGFFPDVEWDSFITLGRATNEDPGSDVWYLELPMASEFATSTFSPASGGMVAYGPNLGTEPGEELIWFVLPSEVNAYGQPPDNRVLLAQVTVPTGTLYYKLNLQVLDDWPDSKSLIYMHTMEEPLDESPDDFSVLYIDGTCMGLVYPEPEFCYGVGCMNPGAVNYDPTATVDDGSCLFLDTDGCMDDAALNYEPDAITDDGSCIYTCPEPHWEFTVDCLGDSLFTVVVSISDLGLLDPSALSISGIGFYANITDNFTTDVGPFASGDTVIFYLDPYDLTGCIAESDPLSIDCGLFNPGCTDSLALNYDPTANWDNETCIYECIYPDVTFSTWCDPEYPGGFVVSMQMDSVGNAVPYTVLVNEDTVLTQMWNPFDWDIGPFYGDQVAEVFFYSQSVPQCEYSSGEFYMDCVSPYQGCTDSLALNFNPDVWFEDGSCTYNFLICDCNLITFSPAERLRLGDGIPDEGVPGVLNFNCEIWGWDCGDIPGSPTDDPYQVCDGSLPDEYGCIVNVPERGMATWNMWPNPANDQVFVYGDEEVWSIEVFNALGQKVYAASPQRKNLTIPSGAWNEGTYFVKVNQSETKPLLIIHHGGE